MFNANCLDKMKDLESNSIDAIVTDPPYGLSFMGKKWDYDVPSVEIWKEALRVLKPGGHLLSFGGTRTYHRMVVNIEDAGFEIRDQIQWLYGSGFPKSQDVSKAIDKAAGAEREVIGEARSGSSSRAFQSEEKTTAGIHSITEPSTELAKKWQGWGTALKPANEPICLARKPLEGTVSQNVSKWGTGAINVDGSRIGIESRTQLSGKGTNANCYGKYGKGDVVKVQGRWPANIILDEVAAEMLDEQSGKLVSKWGKQRAKHDGKKSMFGLGVPDSVNQFAGDSGGASRFFYVAKASKRERNAGLEGMPRKQVSHMITGSGKPSESVKERSAEGEPNRFTATHSNHHPTVKPVKLMEYLIKLVTPPNGTVLDPFMGSGSTGVAAKNLGFKFIGIEMNEEYFEIAKRRIGA